jgi:ubiquitin fusion degradation protein 1
MADKLKIDINSTTSATSSRPPSVASVRPPSSLNDSGGEFETFKGLGATLNGRKTKGKGKAKKLEEVDKDSKIIRTE